MWRHSSCAAPCRVSKALLTVVFPNPCLSGVTRGVHRINIHTCAHIVEPCTHASVRFEFGGVTAHARTTGRGGGKV